MIITVKRPGKDRILLLYILKNIILTPLIKWAVRHPGIMESKLFLKAMQVFPAKISKSFDRTMAGSIAGYSEALVEGLRQVDISPGRILDLCTGTGFAAFITADIFPNGEIDAVDQSPEMLAVGKAKAEENGISNIRFIKGNARSLEYENDQFDLIVTSNAPVYPQEAARVLKPGGFFLASFTFGGDAIAGANKDIAIFLQKNGLHPKELQKAGSGAYVLGQKPAPFE